MNLSNLDKNKTYLLACSGGPDSMALFYLLMQSGYHFEVAHVNYHLREESNQEETMLKEYCQKSDKKLHVLSVDNLGKGNLENRCRIIRYSYFKDIMDNYHLSALLVAQHQDDHIETFLLQKDRQNLPIYYGINEKTHIFGVDVIRPLLDYSKAQLLDICHKNNVPFSIDQTNLTNDFKRNKIRHEIIDRMSDYDRKKILSDIHDKNMELRDVFAHINSIDIGCIQELIKLDKITYMYAINELAKHVDNKLSISKNQCNEIYKILLSDKPNIKTKIRGELLFVKEYEHCYFLLGDANEVYSYVLETPSKLDTPYFYLDFSKDGTNRNVQLGDYPLTIRNAQKGDVVSLKNYECSLRRLFIDWKMPMSLRKRWPVIVNKNNKVIYVPRYQKNFKPDDNTNFYVK